MGSLRNSYGRILPGRVEWLFPSVLEPNSHIIMFVWKVYLTMDLVGGVMIWEKLEMPGFPALFIFTW